MGMPGMTNEAVAAYAATENKNNVEKTASSNMTVAEFRNKINNITHYYDNYDVDDFVADQTIDMKMKFNALFGKFIANIIDYEKINAIIKEMK